MYMFNNKEDFEKYVKGVATVDNAGIVTGVSTGTATITVKDSVSGVSATLDITVGAEISLDANLLFKLDSTSVSDGAVSDLEKDGITYPVITDGTLTVDDTDNSIIFDGTQGVLVNLSNNTSIAGDASRSIVVKFAVGENVSSGVGYKILGHASSSAVTNNKMKWGSGHTGIYYKNDLLLADAGTTNLLKSSDAVSVEKSTVHELVSIYDKESASYKIYLDNTLVKETTELASAGIKACTYIGNNQTDGNFIGKLYELSLYDKALSVEEIESL